MELPVLVEPSQECKNIKFSFWIISDRINMRSIKNLLFNYFGLQLIRKIVMDRFPLSSKIN